MKIHASFALSMACLLCACASAPAARPGAGDGSSPASAPVASEPVLYARDGSVVQGSGAEPAHDLRARESGRVYLLDLYQQALDEREALALEVRNLNVTLEQQQGTYTQLEQERTTLDERVQALAKDLEALRSENADLAARLTTAQIRRLEAEKLLLEAKIDAQRGQAASASATFNATASHGIGSATPKSSTASKPATHAARGDQEHRSTP